VESNAGLLWYNLLFVSVCQLLGTRQNSLWIRCQ